jgi:hypothetical protein
MGSSEVAQKLNDVNFGLLYIKTFDAQVSEGVSGVCLKDVLQGSVAKHELVYHKTNTRIQVCNTGVRIWCRHVRNGLGHARVEQ